jgi:hypothetical protein
VSPEYIQSSNGMDIRGPKGNTNHIDYDMSLSSPGYGRLSQRRSPDVTFASDDTHSDFNVDMDDIHTDVPLARDEALSHHPQTRHFSKRSLTFSIFVDNLRFQPQLFTGLGAQVFAVG